MVFLLILALTLGLLAAHVHDVGVPGEEGGGEFRAPVVEHGFARVPGLTRGVTERRGGVFETLEQARGVLGSLGGGRGGRRFALELLQKLTSVV